MTLRERLYFRSCVGTANMYGALFGFWLAGQADTDRPIFTAVVGVGVLIAVNAISQGLFKMMLGMPDLES